jgi:hypothetical protein
MDEVEKITLTCSLCGRTEEATPGELFKGWIPDYWVVGSANEFQDYCACPECVKKHLLQDDDTEFIITRELHEHLKRRQRSARGGI